MDRYLRTTSKAGTAGPSRLWKWIASFARLRRFARADHLTDHILRDIGLGDTGRSEPGKIERFRRPKP